MNFSYLIFITLLSISFTTTSKEEKCDTSNCKNPNGECIDNICLCAAGYTTTSIKKNINIFNIIEINREIQTDFSGDNFCNYPLRYKFYAANLEAIFPFGVGHLYTARYNHAIIKFLIFWFLSFSRVLFKKRISIYVLTEKAYYLLLWIFAAIYVIDFAGFIFNYYRDGNDMMLLD